MTQERITNETPLTVTISSHKKTKGIVSVFDDVSDLRALKFSREKISDIPDEWKIGYGFYVLVSETVEGKFSAYVGKATQNNFYTRLSSYKVGKGNWSTVFLFRRDTTSSLNSTQASYIENAIYQAFKTCPWINLINAKAASDQALIDHDAFYMNQVIKSTLRILSIFGFSVEEDYEDPAVAEPSYTRYYGVSVLDLVRSGLLVEGEKTISLMESIPANATIGNNGIVYAGKKGSPSGTAKDAKIQAKTGKTIANGWTFWGVYRNSKWISLDEVRAHYIAQKELYERSLFTDTSVSFEDSHQMNRNSWDEYASALEEDSLVDSGPTKDAHTKERQALFNAISVNILSHKTTDTDPSRHLDSRVKIYELVDAGLLEEGMVIVSTDTRYPVEATIANGGIAFNNNIYPDPRIAGKYARRTFEPDAAAPDNGWEFWAVHQPDGQTVLFSKILDDFS
jgi:hypothetical protein